MATHLKFLLPFLKFNRLCDSNLFLVLHLRSSGVQRFRTSIQKKPFLNVANILMNYVKSDPIPWEDIKGDLLRTEDENLKISLHLLILNSCLNQNLVDIALSYYKFVVDSNYKLTPSECYILLLILKNCGRIPDKYLPYTDLLFKSVKPLLSTHQVIFNAVVAAFYPYEPYYLELVKVYEEEPNKENFLKTSLLSVGGFYHNKPEIGWKIIKNHPDLFDKCFVESYLDYCMKLAENNKFKPLNITDLVEFCYENGKIIPLPNLPDKISVLVKILNKNKNESYFWNANRSVINNNGNCSSCSSKMGTLEFTQSDFEKLKNHILTNNIINKNVNVKTSAEELSRFLNFLKCCPKYDIVVDGLNVVCNKPFSQVNKVLEYFKKKNMKLLIIGKKEGIMFKYFKILKEECIFFLTDNKSDDDLFMIYAALHGGVKTYFLTNDCLRGHSHLIKNELKKVFLKWQLSHQYSLNKHPFYIQLINTASATSTYVKGVIKANPKCIRVKFYIKQNVMIKKSSTCQELGDIGRIDYGKRQLIVGEVRIFF